MNKKFLLSVVVACAAAFSAKAQITIDDFSTAPAGVNFTGYQGTWAGAVTTSGGILTVTGGDATGYFGTADINAMVPIDTVAHNFTQVTVTARIDANHQAPGVSINFYDSSGLTALTATFATNGTPGSFVSGSFTTQTLVLQVHGEAGNAMDITYYGIQGAGNTEAFRMSFDSIVLSAVPEPATYAMLLGAVGLGYAVWRRRSARA